ncbi:unnamed protein product [Symbiodinium necroappetens]|uniref:Uncharacterized protein n=1 Tax=Symbiodinium necroappetens TaxID=1628268 RepID=A0A812IRE4_9DINO|nr:unnamed protein product [Symbiodinium necroappetens]
MASGSAPIDLDTPSPRPAQAKRRRVHCDGSASEDDDGLPRVGEARRIFRSHLFRCLCKGNLAEARKVDATLYGMSGPEKVSVVTVRCTSYSCRRTYGPHFYIDRSVKINTLPDVDVAEEAIFLSPKIGFTVNYLRYHMLLEFRALASARAALDVYSRVCDIEHCSGGGHFRDVHGSSIMYFIALSEYPPHDFCCDGHAKAHVKCDSLDKKHPGKPRANGKRKPYGYGWFMAVDPRTLRVLGVSCLDQPEGDEVMDGILTRLLPKYPLLDGIVLDRACAFLPHAKRTREFAQVGYWCVDYFHGAKHSDQCPCNPHYVRRLARRFANVNTSAAEQVFTWFRQYARVC